MTVRIIFLCLASMFTNSIFCQKHHEITSLERQKLEKLKKEVSDDLTKNILPYWSVRMVDNINGGFYGRIDGSEKVYPDAEKGGILNARILWTYSAAYRTHNDTSYLRLATRAKDYILEHFIDKEYGGAFMSLNADGTPADSRKHVYTNAFFIYGLSEYSRATGDNKALAEAMKIFKLFEEYASDKEYDGYFEVFDRKWERIHDRIIGETSARDEKTMNTTLHVLEAYANLYRVTGDKTVGDRLSNLIEIFLDRIVDKETSHLICFMDRSWNSTSTINSYGHDIESSWLLCEAAGLLEDAKLKNRVEETSIKIANAASEGYQADGSMLTEMNYVTGHIRTQRSWWEQAETVVGYLNAFEITGDDTNLERSLRTWAYIKSNFIDMENGSWYSSVSAEGIPGGEKAGFWICPYHNGRMCMEVVARISGI